MTAPITASKQPANGKTSWWLVPAIADQNAPTVAEINSATGLNITGFVLADQAGFQPSTSKTALPRLLVETKTTQVTDQVTLDMPDIVGVFDPQAAAGSDDKKFWDLVKTGFTGYIVRRQNVVAGNAKDVVAGQFVDTAHITIWTPTPDQSATDASGIYTFSVSCDITNFVPNVAVTA